MKRTASSVVCEAFLDTATVFTLTSLLFLPVLTEIILLFVYPESSWITFSCCSAVLTIASVVGALDFGAFIEEYGAAENKGEIESRFWGPSFRECRTLKRGSYIIFSCAFWELVNMLTSLGNNVSWYIRLFAFAPLIVYVPFVAAGCTFSRRIRELENKKD